ncbi:MAG: NAD(P)H-binding protein, partial [Anaerolineae bacterium]|nr:NAD(P)H-binding protein [Anaerolineae bacterium]
MISPQKTILVTGATGYVGGRLIPRLLEAGYTVRGMTRHAEHLHGREWSDDIEIVEGDVLEPDSLSSVLEGVSTAYYFIHSMEGGANFDDRDAQAAHNFGDAASTAGVERIIYLGGLGVESEENLSEHLESRQQVGDILREYEPAVTEFRAAILVGSGSISFEMIRYLTERVPIMICPQWVFTKVQPIAIKDALDYLQAALTTPESKDRIVEIGGEDVL